MYAPVNLSCYLCEQNLACTFLVYSVKHAGVGFLFQLQVYSQVLEASIGCNAILLFVYDLMVSWLGICLGMLLLCLVFT